MKTSKRPTRPGEPFVGFLPERGRGGLLGSGYEEVRELDRSLDKRSDNRRHAHRHPAIS